MYNKDPLDCDVTSDYNAMKPLLEEFENMRNTLQKFTELIKQQHDTVLKQGGRIAALEAKLADVVFPTHEQALAKRYADSKRRNRTITALPQEIALAAHFIRVKHLPNMAVARTHLLSPNKLQGLKNWETQHLMDYCELHNVADIYEHGLDDGEIQKLLPREGYEYYLSHIKESH